MTHDWDWMTDICMECGLDRIAAEDAGVLISCTHDDRRSYLLARHRMSVMIDPILETWGLHKHETRH